MTGTKVCAAVPGITRFVWISANRSFLTVADRFEFVARDAHAAQSITNGGRATTSQADVVLRRAPLIAMTFDGHHERRIHGEDGFQSGGIGTQGGLVFRSYVAL